MTIQNLDRFLPYIRRVLRVFWSYVVALARLFVWTIIFFFSGLQRTLFTRDEVAGVDMKLMPLRCDMEDADEKLAYIDKLCLENPDLAEMAEQAYLDDEKVNNDIDDLPFDDGEEGD